MRLCWRHPGNNGTVITSYNIEVTGCKNISFDVVTSSEEETPAIQEYDVTDLQPNTLYRYEYTTGVEGVLVKSEEIVFFWFSISIMQR